MVRRLQGDLAVPHSMVHHFPLEIYAIGMWFSVPGPCSSVRGSKVLNVIHTPKYTYSLRSFV